MNICGCMLAAATATACRTPPNSRALGSPEMKGNIPCACAGRLLRSQDCGDAFMPQKADGSSLHSFVSLQNCMCCSDAGDDDANLIEEALFVELWVVLRGQSLNLEESVFDAGER